MTPTASPTDGEDGDSRGPVPASVDAGPFTATWDVTRAAETTFVTVHVSNAHPRDRTVRVENRLDGAVRPPRRNGVEEPGWDTDGVTTAVPGDGTVSLGYACRAAPLDPPVALRTDTTDVTDSPVDRALRSLGDHAPPRAAIPDPDASENTPDSSGGRSDTDGRSQSPPDAPASSTRGADSVEPSPSVATAADPPADTPTDVDAVPPEASTDERTADGPVPLAATPTTVTAWFRAVDARVDTADRLAGPVEEATPIVASLGGRRGVETLATTLTRDASALRAVAEHALSLAARIEETDVPDLEAVE